MLVVFFPFEIICLLQYMLKNERQKHVAFLLKVFRFLSSFFFQRDHFDKSDRIFFFL